jgi:UDP-N-acetylmuramoyl-tripeptide--D-alanyl-D-alanine ligase
MNNVFSKIRFVFKRPKIIIVTGQGKETTASAIEQVLEKSFKIGRDIVIHQTDLKDSRDFEFLVKKSSLALLVVSHVGEYHPDKEFFASEQAAVAEMVKLAQKLPGHSYLVLNFDDETVRDIKNVSRAHSLTFGFGVRADLRASDIVLIQPPTPGTNFKVNYQGKIVPVWLDKLFGKENIYAALAAVSVCSILGLNLVEISRALGSYQGFPGRLKLVKGIKKSWVLDDSDSALPLSMVEGLDVLRKIETGGRRVAVLGDIVGVGKYTVEAHESIGEKVKTSADLLFTFGSRAKFYAQGARQKGMADDKIFQFAEIKEGLPALQDQIRENDLILVDGAKEMKMGEIVREIKALD